MKQVGRLGSSAVPGAGCYAVNGDHIHGDKKDHEATIEASVAASVSGCGEDILEQFVAMKCCDMMRGGSEVDSTAKVLSSHIDEGPSTLSSNSLTPTHQMMRRLIVKEHKLPASMASIKKRRWNDSGSQDTMAEDGGLATGIIALKTLERGQGEALELHFSWAHSAHHFGLAFAAGDVHGQKYEGQAWISTQSEQALKSKTMKMGEIHKTIPASSIE
jgi:hypothetical protein